MPKLGEDTRDAVGFCARDFSDALAAELKATLATEGAWFVLGPAGETVFVYAPQKLLAAGIRFGV